VWRKSNNFDVVNNVTMTSIIPQAKFLNMKLLMKLTTLLLLFGISATSALAQYDDVYYDPERNTNRNTTERKANPAVSSQTYSQNSDSDQAYDDEDYDYYYTSRIRRFHRPYTGFGYYDPIYVDAYYYDAYARPGIAALIYDDPFGYYGWNRLQRWSSWNRFNSFGYGGYSPFNRWNSWNSYDPFWGNSGFGLGFGFNRWNSWNNFGWGSPYCGNNWFNTPSWGNNYYYNNNNFYNNNYNSNRNDNNRGNVYYGPRNGGGGVGSQPGIDNPNGRSPRFTNDPDIKSNPGTTRPDYSGGRKLDASPSYDPNRTVPGANPRTVTPDQDRNTVGSPNNADRYRDARENLNRTDYNSNRTPGAVDPFSGGRRQDNLDRSYSNDRSTVSPERRAGVQDNGNTRSYNTPERSYNAPRSIDNGGIERSRSYTPDRSYERSRENTAPRSYDSPRNQPSQNSGFDSNRSFSNPRSFDGGSGGGNSRSSSPSPSPSGGGNSSSGGRSNSGGRQ
jgi:hypothetical protein